MAWNQSDHLILVTASSNFSLLWKLGCLPVCSLPEPLPPCNSSRTSKPICKQSPRTSGHNVIKSKWKLSHLEELGTPEYPCPLGISILSSRCFPDHWPSACHSLTQKHQRDYTFFQGPTVFHDPELTAGFHVPNTILTLCVLFRGKSLLFLLPYLSNEIWAGRGALSTCGPSDPRYHHVLQPFSSHAGWLKSCFWDLVLQTCFPFSLSPQDHLFRSFLKP